MTDPMSPEELRACRKLAERALPGSRLRRLLATIAERDAHLEAIGDVLAAHGCDCDRDHHEEECDDECDHGDPCLACRIEAAMKGASQ